MYPKPIVSVIVPVFNRESLILDTLQTIANQTFRDFECLIVDDGSTDRSRDLILEFSISDSRFKLLERPENDIKGAPTCRNIGLNYANGDFIQFFDSDDIMLPEALADKYRVLSQNQSAKFVVSKTAFLYGDGSFKHPDQRLTIPDSYEKFLSNKTSFFTPGPLFRKSFLLSFNKGFEQGLKRHQEWEYYTRIMADLPEFEIIDKVHCHYRMHSESIKAKSDEFGNLYYRRTKLHAIRLINRNTGFHHAQTIRRAFWPYAITTLKVALYNVNMIMVLITIRWMLSMYTSQLKK